MHSTMSAVWGLGIPGVGLLMRPARIPHQATPALSHGPALVEVQPTDGPRAGRHIPTI
ncbi:MAG: hypothetical protein ACP5JG_02410 [Anaerolineae bacterium]